MDRSLDEIISERPQPTRGGSAPRGPRSDARRPLPRAPRRDEYPRDGVRKFRREEPGNIETDWVHDRFDDDRQRGSRRPPPELEQRPERFARAEESGTKLRIDNLHYELSESDLRELFSRIGRVTSVRLLYDRMDRSEGTAFVTYDDARDARDAVADFNGQNAYGQPIKVTLLPTAPAAHHNNGALPPKGSLFDRVERPARSLFDRIEGRPRSESPPPHPRATARRPGPVPDHVDRYVPGARDSRSPVRRRGTPRESGRRPGQRREESGRGGGGGGAGGRRPRTDEEGRPIVGGRPKKTAQELDAEMADYFASSKDQEQEKVNGTGHSGETSAATASAAQGDGGEEDIDMIE